MNTAVVVGVMLGVADIMMSAAEAGGKPGNGTAGTNTQVFVRPAGETAKKAAGTNAQEVVRFNNTICPVTGNSITPKRNKEYHVVYHNVRYELCCSGCPPVFKNDPEKCLATLPNNGSIVDLGNTVCPVMEGAVDDSSWEVYNGTKVHFCCPACTKTFRGDPETYLKKAREQMASGEPPKAVTPTKDPNAKLHCTEPVKDGRPTNNVCH